jgi:hypothetical protein
MPAYGSYIEAWIAAGLPGLPCVPIISSMPCQTRASAGRYDPVIGARAAELVQFVSLLT